MVKLTDSLIGEYPHRVEAGRLFIPPELIHLFDASKVYMYHNFEDGCLLLSRRTRLGGYLYPLGRRYNLNGHRLSLPKKVRQRVRLGKDVVIIGIGNAIEVWDKERWEAEKVKGIQLMNSEYG